MKLLHTSDWHVGKTLRGRSRAAEHRRVLAELIDLARAEDVDLVCVTGDLYDTAMPPAEAQHLVVATLLALTDRGAGRPRRPVVAIAGNHDPAPVFDAYRPVMSAAGITLVGAVRAAADGGVRTLTTEDGTAVRVAALPFVPARLAVRAAELVTATAAQHVLAYEEVVRQILAALTAGFDRAAVNVVLGHLSVAGGRLGGGEREIQTVGDYWVRPDVFPATVDYVALGHLHATQHVPAPTTAWYAGAPLAIDFGDADDDRNALVVTLAPGVPAVVRAVPLTGGRRLRTVTGTLAELREIAARPAVPDGPAGPAWLRVLVREAARAGLADDVRALLPEAVEVRLDLRPDPDPDGEPRPRRAGRGPGELFAAYLTEQGVEDDAVRALFADLLDADAAGS